MNMSVIDCNKIPEIIWLEIFMHLDAQSLLRITEACKLFDSIFVSSRKLCDKIRIKVNTNEDVALQLRTLMNSQRTYRNLYLGCDETVRNRTDPQLEGFNLDKIRSLFGENITNLKLKNIYMKTNSIVELLKSFVKLKGLALENIRMSDHSNFYFKEMTQQDHDLLKRNFFPFEQLNELIIRRTDFFCFYFLQNAHSLKKFVVNDLVFDQIDVEHFEKFLATQTGLKELRLRKFRGNCIFKTDLLASPPFQLETLAMSSVYWRNKDNGTAFFKSQRNLKTFELALKNRWHIQWDEMMWFNDILKYIFTQNRDLEKVVISTMEKHGYNIKSCDFLVDIVCPKVISLSYFKGLEDETTAFMEIFVKMFPNVKFFTFNTYAEIGTPDLAFLSSWKHLESLAIFGDSYLLSDIHAPNLTSFDYESFGPCINGLMRDISDFTNRHPKIRHFKLNGETYVQEFEH